MDLFENKERVNKVNERGKSQSLYDFLDESAHENHEKIRIFLNYALKLYDEESQKRIVDDIVKNKNSDEKFYSSCFELIVSYIFREIAGYTLEPHPSLSDTDKKPDFLVTTPDGEPFYLELVTVGENDDSQLVRIKEYIKKFQNINKSSGQKTEIAIIDVVGRGFSHDDIDELYREISAWWNDNKNNIGEKLIKTFNDNSICFEIVIQGELFIESLLDNTKFHEKLLDSLEKKAKRYGQLDFPFVIAITFRPSVFSDGVFLQDTLIAASMYGGKIWDCNQKKERNIKSFWEAFQEKKRNRQVGGVLYFDSLTPERLEGFGYVLFLNHFSDKPLPSDLKEFLPYYYVINKDEARQDSQRRRNGNLIVNACLL